VATTGTPDRPDVDAGPGRVASRLVPVAAGVVTWLLVLLAGGFLLSLNSLSVMSIVAIPALGVLFVPLNRLRPWQPGFTGRVLALPETRRTTLAVAVGLFLVARLPVVSELLAPVLGLLLFPLRLVPQLFFGPRILYDARFGEPVGQWLFAFGRLYVEFLWLYGVGAFVSHIVPGGD